MTIHLRAIEPEDLDALYELENDSELWAQGITNVPYSRYQLHDYVANATADIYVDGQVRLVIESADKQFIGLADITSFDATHRRAEAGLMIKKSFRHQGIGHKVMMLLADYALRILHLHQLYAVIDINNEACIQLFRDLGYRESSRLTDWLFDGTDYHDAVVMQRCLLRNSEQTTAVATATFKLSAECDE